MTEFRGVWSEDDVDAFLAETTVPVRLATHRPDGTLWVVTLWYRHRDGGLECATQANADVVGFLGRESSVAFDISTNRIPYRGVRGNGTATVSADGGTETLRDLVDRYLGGSDSALADTLLSADREEVRIRIEPDVIYSWDFSDRMSDVSTDDG
ncbi:pyridoxamine 5'-phosphate oxidase family protein [Halovivax gelatinilyticus]|uniref:pyridoxamine 5'-phosphate oxidase family protein n=1 Tax=Halovivax gelatinilyticus TaxID=2961597 RepID=UPI0020CA8F6B|nr:pyridoxamine 5'-phosphate oxidase family protein [Halovivax gelatinilyticus]